MEHSISHRDRATRQNGPPSRLPPSSLTGALSTGLGIVGHFRSIVTSIVVVAVVAGLVATPALGDDDDSWWTKKHGTGSWDGLRERWKETGIVPGGFYVFDLLRNPTGGLDQTTAYAGRVQFDLSLNLNRLLGARGLAFDVAASWSYGTNLSESIGNVFQVGEVYSGRTVELSRLFLEQTLANSKLYLKLGRVSAANDFAILPANIYYVNAAINGNPLSIPLNDPGFFADPVAQWGLRFLIKPSDLFWVRVAAYNPDPSVGDEGNHGLDFSFNPANGVLAMAEISFRPKIRAGGEEYGGLYKVGVYHDSSDFEYLDDPFRTSSGQYGYYLMGEQDLFHEAGDPIEVEFRPFFGRHIIRTETPLDTPFSHQGLTSWFVVARSPREEISTMPVYVAGGLLYRGLFKHRDTDRAGVAVYYGRFSDRLPRQTDEIVIELNYGIHPTAWLYVTPDIQYVINPGGSDVPSAFVIGLEVGIVF